MILTTLNIITFILLLLAGSQTKKTKAEYRKKSDDLDKTLLKFENLATDLESKIEEVENEASRLKNKEPQPDADNPYTRNINNEGLQNFLKESKKAESVLHYILENTDDENMQSIVKIILKKHTDIKYAIDNNNHEEVSKIMIDIISLTKALENNTPVSKIKLNDAFIDAKDIPKDDSSLNLDFKMPNFGKLDLDN